MFRHRILFLALLAASVSGCSDRAMPVGAPPGQDPAPSQPGDPTAEPGEPSAALAATYLRVSPAGHPGSSRFDLYEDGRFSLEFERVIYIDSILGERIGSVRYRGTAHVMSHTIAFEFDDAPPQTPWRATGTVQGDSLVVRFNDAMRSSQTSGRFGFEDGVYLRPDGVEPPPPPISGRLAFVREREDQRHIFLSDLDGTEATPLTLGSRPTWSPDGGQLAFTRSGGASGESPGIYLIEVGGDNLRWFAHGWSPAWSPDGMRIAFTDEEGIRVAELDGSEARTIVPHDFRDDTYAPWDQGVGSPQWSPDGLRLTFTHHGDFDMWPPKVFVVNADGSGIRRLLEDGNPYQETHSAWSPDGNEVAFGSGYIAIVAADGSPSLEWLYRQPDGASSSGPVWTSDGRWILFEETMWERESQQSSGGIHAVDRLGGFRRLLIPDASFPAWTPHD